MIDKIQPRKLDKDTDQKLVQKTSMIDALNIYVDENLVGTEAGAGVLKPVLGTDALSFTDGFEFGSDSDVRILGSTVDDLTNILYFYVWSSDASEQGVYAYDHKSVLSANGGLRKIFTSRVFNFPPDGFVTGDVVYKRERGREDGSTLPDVDSILYFTDGVNEPRKLDIYRALFGGGSNSEVSAMPESTNFYKIHDVLCACPKVPMDNIDFSFSADTQKQVSNFDGVPGVQFAMQGVYTDGSVTAIGPYSKIAFPTSVVNRGSAPAANLLNDNVCNIKIPQIQEDIETIKILYRYGNKATFRELAEVPNQQDNNFNDDNWSQDSREYKFYNDQISTGVSPSDVAKTFDNLPRQAKAQSAVSNRLVFSNFKDGFDPYKPKVTTTVLFKKRPAEGVNFTIDLRPTIEVSAPPFTGGFENGTIRNKSMGFEIDTSEIPANIPEDTTIGVEFTFAPDKNFHVYEGRGAFHQSQHVGPASGNFTGLQLLPVGGPGGSDGRWTYDNNDDNEGTQIECIVSNVEGDVAFNIDESYYGTRILDSSAAGKLLKTAENTERWMFATEAGQGSTKHNEFGGGRSRGLMWDENNNETGQPNVNAAFGRNFGVGYRADENGGDIYQYKGYSGSIGADPLNPPLQNSDCCSWHYKDFNNAVKKTRAAYGTSAAAPLIIQGTSLTFSVKFRIKMDLIGNGKEIVARAIENLLTGREVENPARVEKVGDQNIIVKHGLNVGLTNGQVFAENDPEKYLITMITDVDAKTGVDTDDDGLNNVLPGENMMGKSNNKLLTINQAIDGDTGNAGTNRRIPTGYFILNKADVTFFLEPNRFDFNGTGVGFQLSIADVVPDAEDGIYTCVKRPEPTTPWKAYSTSHIENIVNNGGFIFDLHNEYKEGIDENDRYLLNDKFHIKATSLEVGGSTVYPINAKMVGVLKCLETHPQENGKPFWPCKIDVENEAYQPRRVDVEGDRNPRFRFSLLDGAGGPGGTPPGAASAYGRYENNRFGSVASQMQATFYGAHKEPVRSKLIDMVPSIGLGFDDGNGYNWDNGAQGVLDVGVIGGVFRQIDNNEMTFGEQSAGYSFGGGENQTGYVRTNMVSRVSGSGIPSQAELIADQYDESGIDSGAEQASVVYVLSGPFFTGSIALNPIAASGTDEGAVTKGNSSHSFKGETAVGNQVSDYVFMNGALGGAPINADQQWVPRGVYDQTTSMPYIFSGSLSPAVYGNQVAYRSVFPWPIIEPPLPTIQGGGPLNQINGTLASNLYGSNGGDFSSLHPPFTTISWEDRPGHAEMGPVTTDTSGASSKPIMSFKANANHEFGVIYYDERGRHGRVNHIGSVYVPGFSPSERNGVTDGGPAHIRIKFETDAPDWAHYYKIAYSKNTSISDFFQYSTGGAFITAGSNPVESASESAKIYVSLNYLQGHPISYSDSWGGRSQEGSPVVYQPKEGDKVRVISHQQSTSNVVSKVFPRNIVFDVIGVESLGDQPDSNPLVLSDNVPENKQGLFLTIKNNPAHTGFRYSDIEQGVDLWDKNCIIEIFRPFDELDAESRIYYEIGPTFRCGSPQGGINIAGAKKHLNHNNEDAPIEIVDGDVFFRKTAVNLKEFEGGEFIDLISDTAPDGDEFVSAEPNFRSIFTEATSATDLYKSDSISIGRPNKIDNNEKEQMRIASLVHSDKDITKSSKLGYSSFNRTESNDKDLDVAHGDIDYTANTDDSLLIIQKNKVGHIPVDRNLISTADNEPSLISSSKFLGTVRYYAGRGGSDGHPESIAMADGNAYFAHKTDGKVFRASGANGLLEISSKAMKTFFRNLFSSMGKNDKIVGGYDPIKQEYLINVQAVEDLTSQNGETIDQDDSPYLTFNTEFLDNSSTTDNIVENANEDIEDEGTGLGGEDGPG